MVDSNDKTGQFFDNLVDELNQNCLTGLAYNYWKKSFFSRDEKNRFYFKIKDYGCFSAGEPCRNCKQLLQRAEIEFVRNISEKDYVAVKFFDNLSNKLNNKCETSDSRSFSKWTWKQFKYNLATIEFEYDNHCYGMDSCETCKRILEVAESEFKILIWDEKKGDLFYLCQSFLELKDTVSKMEKNIEYLKRKFDDLDIAPS